MGIRKPLEPLSILCNSTRLEAGSLEPKIELKFGNLDLRLGLEAGSPGPRMGLEARMGGSEAEKWVGSGAEVGVLGL